jgi:type II secretory pathway pseudopilin PulG
VSTRNIFKFKRGGFTIIELVISIFIFVAMIALITTITLTMSKSATSTQSASQSQSVLLDATNRITRDISYATRIIRSDANSLKVETLENGQCLRSDWSIIPAVDEYTQPIMKQGDFGLDGTVQRYDLVNTLERYTGVCPDDRKATFGSDNELSDPSMIPVIEKKIVVTDFDRYFDGGKTEAKPLGEDAAEAGVPPAFEYLDKSDQSITSAETPKSFIRRIRFTVATTAKDRDNPLKISTSAIPYAGGSPSSSEGGIVVPLAPVLGAQPYPLSIPSQSTFNTPDKQWIQLRWTNPTPSITTGYIVTRLSASQQGGLPERVAFDDASLLGPEITEYEDITLPRGTCAEYQVYAVTVKGLSAGSNFRRLCMPADPVQNLVTRADNASVDSLNNSEGFYDNNRRDVTGLIPGQLDFTQDRYNQGRSWVELEWDSVHAEGAAGLGYDVYLGEVSATDSAIEDGQQTGGILVASLDSQGNEWVYDTDSKAPGVSLTLSDYTSSVSRSITPKTGIRWQKLFGADAEWVPGEKITWGAWVPLDQNLKFSVVPFVFWQDNTGNSRKIDAYNVAQRANLDTQWGTTVNAVTTPAPVTVRHSYPDANGQRVTLNWPASSVARGYRIYRSTMTSQSSQGLVQVRNPQNYNWVHAPTMELTSEQDTNSGWALVGETTSNTWTSTDANSNGIAAGTKYVYKVVAWNRPGMWPREIVWDENPEQWLNDRGGFDIPDSLPRNGGRASMRTLKTEEAFINIMSRTINTVFGVPSPAQPQCKVNVNDRTVALSWPDGISYPQTAQIDVHRSGESSLGTPGRFVHTETQDFGALGLYVNANNTPQGSTVQGTDTNVGQYDSGNGFGKITVNMDANAPGQVTVNANIPGYPRSPKEGDPFTPGTSGNNPSDAGINQNGGTWTVPNSLTRWGDKFRFTFRALNEAGASSARAVDCYIPMPVATDNGLFNNSNGFLNAPDNDPASATNAESRYFNVPGVQANQLNNYRTKWQWSKPNAAYTYPQNSSTNSSGRPDYADNGYEYWVYFEPINRNAPPKGGPWLPGVVQDCAVEPESLGGYPTGRGELVKLPSNKFSYETVSEFANSSSAASQRAWDHDVWIYAVNLETGKRILTSSSCHVEEGTPFFPAVGSTSNGWVDVYGLPSPNPFTGNGVPRREYINKDVEMNLGRMAIDIYRSEYVDFDEIKKIKNISQSWPNPLPSGYTLAVCNRPDISGVRPAQGCSDLVKNPNTEMAQRGTQNWKVGLNTIHLLEELVPGFEYFYEIQLANGAGYTTANTNYDFTFPYRYVLNALTTSNSVQKSRAYWNEGCGYNNQGGEATGITHQLSNSVQFHLKRAEDYTAGVVAKKCQSRTQGGPLAMIAVANVPYYIVDGLGRYDVNNQDVHRASGYFSRGATTYLPNGRRGVYTTSTVNPWRSGRTSYAAGNPGAPSILIDRVYESGGQTNSTAKVNVHASSLGNGCSLYTSSTGSIPDSFNNVRHLMQCGSSERVNLANPGPGAWINCGLYNLTCEYRADYTYKNYYVRAAMLQPGCRTVNDTDNDEWATGCTKHGYYESAQTTLQRMSDVDDLPKPKPKPTPTPTPTPTRTR